MTRSPIGRASSSIASCSDVQGEGNADTARSLSGAAALTAVTAHAQEEKWPARPLRIIIPTAPGGSPDIASRLLGDKITPRLGQSLVVESMTAGGGVPGLQLVSKSADGHTFAMLTGGFATQAAVLKNLPYDAVKDFAFITSVVRYPIVYAVRPDSEIKSFKDYIERARAAPEQGDQRHRRRRLGLSPARQVDRQHGRHRNQPGVLSRHGSCRAGRARRAPRCDDRCIHQHDPAHPKRPAARARRVLG